MDASPAGTWELVGDPTSVPRWYPKYETAEVAGTQRVLRNAEGGELVETIDEHDDERPALLTYSVVSGAPVSRYQATFEVREREGGGSRVGWTVDAERIGPGGGHRGAPRCRPSGPRSERIKAIVEGRTPRDRALVVDPHERDDLALVLGAVDGQGAPAVVRDGVAARCGPRRAVRARRPGEAEVGDAVAVQVTDLPGADAQRELAARARERPSPAART